MTLLPLGVSSAKDAQKFITCFDPASYAHIASVSENSIPFLLYVVCQLSEPQTSSIFLHLFPSFLSDWTCSQLFFFPFRGLKALPADSPTSIAAKITLADTAQRTTWRHTTFRERRTLLRSLLGWVTRDMEVISRVAVRDSGKTMLDSAFGEILTTCSKIEVGRTLNLRLV